jgi:hypothetical protein
MAHVSTSHRFVRLACVIPVAAALCGCGPEFDPPSKLQSLRVLAIQKSHPYLQPTPPLEDNKPLTAASRELDYVQHMTLAMEDGRSDDIRKNAKLQKLWFAGCNNPPGDSYYGCLLNVWLSFKAFSELGPGPAALANGEAWAVGEHIADIGFPRIQQFLADTFPKQYAEAQNSGSSEADPAAANEQLFKQALALRVGAGDSFDYKVPSWVIAEHRSTSVPAYGFSQVFSAVCDGEIGLSPGWESVDDPLAVLSDATRGFPLTCYEAGTKRERGPDNFMVSYSNLYVYESLRNNNPVIDSVEFDGKSVDASAVCLGAACLDQVESEDVCATESSLPRVKLCRKNSASDCKEYDLSPKLVAADNFDKGVNDLPEQMWIRYYATKGDIKREVKRLRDAKAGWFDDHKTSWKVPTEGAGPVHLWSVAYDNRGGVDWARTTICLEEG